MVQGRRSEGQLPLFPAGTERRVVEGAGHFLPRERPGAVVDALRTAGVRHLDMPLRPSDLRQAGRK